MIAKCSECGNTIKIDKILTDEIVACPTCETNYKAIVKDGKTKLTEYTYENKDPGEL